MFGIMDLKSLDEDRTNEEEHTYVGPGLTFRTTSSMPNDEESDRS
jgi:hypothetical protein